MSTFIITDSTAYLPDEIINQYNVTILSLNVHLPDHDFKEGQDMSNAAYYQYLKENRVFPSTSQPAAGEFLEVFKRLQPGDEALVILLSSKLSGTVQSAQIACSMMPPGHPPITIIDSMSSAMGLGFQVMRAGEMLEQGHSIEKVAAAVSEMIKAMQVFFIVDDLEYLSRGGRISKTGSILGNILLVLGLSIFLGGLKNGEQKFDRVHINNQTSLLLLANIALIIPAVFFQAEKQHHALEGFSLAVALIFIIIYFMLVIVFYN